MKQLFVTLYEQGLLKRLITLEEMFEKSTLDLKEKFVIGKTMR
jgi:hypothetical protein